MMQAICRLSLCSVLLLSLFGQVSSQALGADCSVSGTCTSGDHVCEDDGAGSVVCKVKADGTATACASTDSNCPADATCATDVCNCDAGWIHDGSGLCTVQNADCSSDACGDITNFVCDTSTNTCEVKADGSATDCASTDGNCPAHASCATTLCSCDAGWIHASGLCIVQDADCSSAACGDTTNYVCDAGSSDTCKVKADGSTTDCASTNGNCPAHASCASTVCNCDAGWIHASGLCTVQDADCSSAACGDTSNYVCDAGSSDTCKVKADGVKTDCASNDDNCPAHATCATTVCNCDAGWTHASGLCTAIVGFSCSGNSDCTALDSNTECSLGSCACLSGYTNAAGGACLVQNADCSSGTACGDTTNYVCDTTTDTCEVKADGAKTDCASTDGNCPAHATCATTVCNCDAGWTHASGLCTAIVGFSCSVDSDCTALDSNTECSSGSCACVSGYTNAAGGACLASDGLKLTASGFGVYLSILLMSIFL